MARLSGRGRRADFPRKGPASSHSHIAPKSNGRAIEPRPQFLSLSVKPLGADARQSVVSPPSCTLSSTEPSGNLKSLTTISSVCARNPSMAQRPGCGFRFSHAVAVLSPGRTTLCRFTTVFLPIGHVHLGKRRPEPSAYPASNMGRHVSDKDLPSFPVLMPGRKPPRKDFCVNLVMLPSALQEPEPCSFRPSDSAACGARYSEPVLRRSPPAPMILSSSKRTRISASASHARSVRPARRRPRASRDVAGLPVGRAQG